MPFVTHGTLENFINERAVSEACHEIADTAGDTMEELTKRNTPVGGAEFRDHAARAPGTARESIYRTPVETAFTFGGEGKRVRVRTEDPVFPYIEWDTRPHEIRPRRPGGSLRWRSRSGVHFAKVVHHPGTKGAHSFTLAAAKTEAELGHIAAPALRRFERELVRDSRL
jgi:hypothetical protein